MCTNYRLSCSCGRNYANLFFKNNILNPDVVSNLYCPECSKNVDFDREFMLADNEWILEFNLASAKGCFQLANIKSSVLNPSFLFDQGYATWNGFTPNELEQRLVERQEIISLAHSDMRVYLAEIKRWGCERAERFREAGWRKAQGC